ncbi:MAG: hypothetical protein FWG89_08775 [Treponema sp.]|nr:hypothetical protein [Treponema sp.]
MGNDTIKLPEWTGSRGGRRLDLQCKSAIFRLGNNPPEGQAAGLGKRL